MLVYRRISSAHLIVLLWVILTLGFVPVFENTLVKMVLVIPTVLFVPGYMLLSVLFPESRGLGAARRSVLSFGISMVIVPLLGYSLNFAFGAKLVPLLVILSLYTATLASIAAYRSGKPVSHRIGKGKLPPDLAVISVWIIAALVFILTPALENTSARTVLAVPVVLFIPGYVLVSALFPKKSDMGFTERIALSLGTSIAVVPALGILLNFTTGIELEPILIALCLYSIILAFIAAYRRGKLSEDVQFSISLGSIYEAVAGGISGSRKDAALTLLLIFIAAFAAGMVYFVVTTPKTGERFTEFYILDQSGKAENYPVNLKYDSPITFPVGVINHEYSFTNYTVQVALDKKILTYTRFMLDHNETWRNNVSFVPGREGTGMKLEFWLFKEDNFTEPYRELQLWVNGVK